MLNLDVESQLPVIASNFLTVKATLIENIKKYQGMIVTEESLKDCKASQGDLAHLRVDIDNRRKEVKREISKPILAFEDQCKELIRLVEDTEKPIKEGIKVFDDKVREGKKLVAENIIKTVIEEQKLAPKYAKQLVVIDKYMNLGAKHSEVRADVDQRALVLKEQQNKELEMLEIIADAIESANKAIKTPISMSDIQYLINSGYPTRDIIKRIDDMAEKIKLAENPPVVEVVEVEEVKPVEVEAPRESSIVDVPKVTKVEQLYFIEVRITGTKVDTSKLGNFLRENEITYKLLNQGRVE